MPPSSLPPEYGLSLSFDQAVSVAQASLAMAKARGWPMVIAVMDAHATLVVLYKMDQANIGSVEVACQKAATAVKFRKSTKAFDDALAGGGASLRILAVPDMLPVEGGLPLMIGGKVCGGIGVSGMQGGQDAEIAAAGAAILT